MLEFTEFPHLASGDPHQAVLALIHVCRELPADGEQFRSFRKRLRDYRMWDQDKVPGTLAFLGIEKAGTMKASPLARSIGAQKADDKARDLLAKRLWEVNALLFKTVLEVVKERVQSRDEVIKHIDSFAYRGRSPTRPQLEAWLRMALGLDLLKMVGIALDLGPRGEQWLPEAANLEVDEFLDDVDRAPADDATTEAADEAPTPAAPIAAAAPAAASGPAPAAASGPAAAPAAASGPAPVPAANPLIDVGGLSSPLGRARPVAVSRFAGSDVFPDDVLDETAARIQAWWSEQSVERASAAASDFGFDAEAWMDNAEELLYRIAVAAALVFRLERDRESVKQIFASLDRAGVLTDLYYGTAPEALPDNVDPRALMLASLIARRCAEAPELAATIEKQPTAGEAFAALDRALGRGLLKIELFWIMGALGELGALRHDDLGQYAALPRRMVRDTLFRLGFVTTPYAHDAPSLVPAAVGARRVAGAHPVPDEVVIGFALAAGCAYDCANRRGCEHACRERAE